MAEFYNDPDAELAWSRDHREKRRGVYDYGMDNVKPNVGIGVVAAAFGCEVTVNDEADPWIKPLIREENVGAVRDLAVPDPVENPVFRKVWDRVEYLEAHAHMPLRSVNIPSPLVTASLIWDYTSFIEGLMLYPEEAHILLEKITEATIGFIREQFRRIKNLFSISHEMWHVPREGGIRISDDTAALLSPGLYREFGVRYNSMIADAFGGVVVHSCGDVRNVVEAMMETRNLKGLDFTIPQNPDWDVIRRAAAGKTALYLRHFYWDHGGGGKTDLAAYSKRILDYFGRAGLFIQTSTETPEEAVALGDELHRILST